MSECTLMEVALRGDATEARRFRQLVQTCLATPSHGESDFGSGWLGRLVEAVGAGPATDDAGCRGRVSAVATYGDDGVWLSLEVLCDEMDAVATLRRVLASFPGLEMLWYADSMGWGHHVTNDADLVICPGRFGASVTRGGEQDETFSNDRAELLEWVGRVFDVTVRDETELDALMASLPPESDDDVDVFEYRLVDDDGRQIDWPA